MVLVAAVAARARIAVIVAMPAAGTGAPLVAVAGVAARARRAAATTAMGSSWCWRLGAKNWWRCCQGWAMRETRGSVSYCWDGAAASPRRSGKCRRIRERRFREVLE